MFDRLSRSWRLVKASAAVLREDKELLLFPLISLGALVLVLASFAVPVVGLGVLDGLSGHSDQRISIGMYVIAFLYEYRWMIEVFFRFLKQILGCRHLLSRSQNGIEIQTYCAIIACMLISLWTGKKPTLRTYEMICWYLIGMADLEELLAHIERLKKHAA